MTSAQQNGVKMDWDLTSYFPAFDGPEMRAHKDTMKAGVAALTAQAAALAPLGAANMAAWEAVFLESERLIVRGNHFSSYIGCLTSADARHEAYHREQAWMSQMWSEFGKLEVEMIRAIKDAPDDIFAAFAARPAFDGIAYYMRRMREEARMTMSHEKEILATELGVDGIGAWGRLYDTISGKLEFDMEWPDGRKKRLSISERTSLLDDTDRRVRRAAFAGGNAAWAQLEDVAAAALNAIAGTRLTLYKHRGIEHFLKVSMFQAAVEQKTIDTMFGAIFDNLDVPRRILDVRGRGLGLDKIAWFDQAAPIKIGNDDKRITWAEGCALVAQAFSAAYPRLAAHFDDHMTRRWIDHSPRAGKRPGGFCTGSLQTKEPRIFMTFSGSMGDVRTLAHEVGHAFHSEVLRDVRPYAHQYPMTLAETASTFAERILTEGLLSDPGIGDEQKAKILDMECSHGLVYLLNIPVRYRFEKRFYEERAQGEIGVSRLKDMVIEAQREVFGDVLEPGGEDPMFWASKLHFYITGVSFYNFPYTFGFLLSRGLYAMFQKEGPAFLPRYEEFLRLTGSDSCEGVARRSLGIDLQKPDFWATAVRSMLEPTEKLEKLLVALNN